MSKETSISSLSSTVAVVASPSRFNDMVDWVESNIASLGGCVLLTSPKELCDRLLTTQQLALDSRMLSLRITPIASAENADVILAGKILEGQVKGVVLFQDYHQSNSMWSSSLLARVCDSSQTPLALNKATADLCLRGVSNTRVAYLIYNPVAGQGDSTKDLELVRSILEPTMMLHVIMTEKDREVTDQVREIIHLIEQSSQLQQEQLEGAPDSSMSSMIIASGGDGTVAAVAGATMGSGIPVAAIPRGTANAFSVALGIPTNVEDAARNILTGHVCVIDGAKCNDTPFINLAGVGFEAGLVDNATRELKNAFGNIAYMIGGAEQSLQQKPFKCKVRVNDDSALEEITTKVITVSNVAPPSSVFAQGFGKIIPDDGLLEVTVITSDEAGPLGELDGLASLWASSLVQVAVPSKNVLRIRAKKLFVECDPPQKLLLDGEVLEGINPVTFEVVPNGLSVVTPLSPSRDE